MHPEQLARALANVDGYNNNDPNRFRDRPLALFQGERAHAWVADLVDQPTPELELAARAHHIGRWEIPRADFPEGRNGYLRWRRDQKKHQAKLLSAILMAEDIAPPHVIRCGEIIEKLRLGSDPEVQAFEDAVCLTFIETQFLSTADKLGDDDKMVDVVAKTLRKMTPAGHAAAATIEVDERSAEIIRRATERISS